MDPHGAGHLGDPADGLFDVSRRNHHEVVELVHDHENERQPLVLTNGVVGQKRWVLAQVAAVVGRVVAGDVAHADFGEQVVPTLHLGHRPGQRVGRFFGVDDD